LSVETPLIDLPAAVAKLPEGLIDRAKSQAEARLAPGTPEQIGEMLLMVAEVLSVEAPSEKAIRVYLRLLNAIPGDLLPLATKRVLESYRYNSFPKPADFIHAIEPERGARMRMVSQIKTLEGKLRIARLWYPES
jgi:hypothetical protein